MPLSKDKIAKATNPSTGLLYRNPTTEDISAKSDTQSDIVRQVLGSGKKILAEVFEPDAQNGVLPGLKKLREMPEEVLAKFFLTMFRTRPNIFALHIRLGDYPDTKEIRKTNKFVSVLQISKPTEYREIAASFAELFADKNLCATELIWEVKANSPGNFFVEVLAKNTSEENYANDEFFRPQIAVEYFPNG
jgi:hypothetical protein